MHMNTIEMIGIAALLIAFVTWRQTQWQSVQLNRLLRMPVVFAVLGVFSLVTSLSQLSGVHFGGLDLAIVGTELILGLLAGWLMGRHTEIATVSGAVKSRLRPVGVGVWLGFIAVRIGLAVAGHQFGAQLATQSGTVLIVVAIIKGVQVALIRERVERHQSVLQGDLAGASR